MNYIKDLYEKRPELVNNFIKKFFQFNKNEKIVEHIEEDEFWKTDEYVELFVGLGGGQYQDLIIEDFAICCNGDYLEIGDKRIDTYLKLMAKIYGDEYVLRFHEYRNGERNEWLDEFDALTTSIEKDMFKAVEQSKKKNVGQVKEQNNLGC